MNSNPVVVIMAGGMGKRMGSSIPKVLHNIGNEPMLVKIIKEALKLNPIKILLVVGHYFELIKSTLKNFINLDYINFIIQSEPLGTGHAILCCIDNLKLHVFSNVLILSADVPLLTVNTMKQLLDVDSVKIVTTQLENPFGYGRIIKKNDQIQNIIEEKDCNDEQRLIKTINCGIYSFQAKYLIKYLPYITNNNSQKEYYLTDIIMIIKEHENISIESYDVPTYLNYEIMGVNTKEQLQILTDILKTIQL